MKRLFIVFLQLLALPLCADLPKRPNVVLILTDDTGYGDVGAHGHPVLKTPHIDRLYREGVRFRDFHVSPTCSPTRSALLTGRHEFRNGVTHTILERERLTLDAITLPDELRKTGYATGIFGKWHLGDEDAYQPQNRGFEEVYIHGGGGIGQVYPGSCGDAPANKYTNPVVRHNGKFEKTSGFCTDVFTAQAIRWMAAVPEDKPFFCYIPYNAAHEPVSCPDADRAPYEGKAPGKLPTYFGMIGNIDTNVGRVLEWLERTGRDRNTRVSCMNDNRTFGLSAKFYNAGMRGSKGTAWHGGTRVTSLWRWKGVVEAHDVHALSAHVDVFPTLAALAGIRQEEKLSRQIEGRSLVPLLEDGGAPWPERSLVTHVGRWPKNADPEPFRYANASIRSGPWHLVWDGVMGRPGPAFPQLFNLRMDPGEQTDVVAANAAVVEKLKAEYDLWWEGVQPALVNEKVQGPEINPFQAAYYKQFGGEPTPQDLQRMNPKNALGF